MARKRKFRKRDNIRNNPNYRRYREIELKEERFILNQNERDRRLKHRNRPIPRGRMWRMYVEMETYRAKNINKQKAVNENKQREIRKINEICRKRKERRETLFATKGSGGGFSRKRKRNITEDSKIKC